MEDICLDNAVQRVDEFIAQTLPSLQPPNLSGRGIVIACGGRHLNTNAWVAIRMLRHLGCELPIQCWYLGSPEQDLRWMELVKPYGVQCIDAHMIRMERPHARLHGWELKPYAITWSSFKEVLFLDADNVPTRNPTYLFETPQFQRLGAVFWPDYGRLGPERLAWKVFGNIPYRDEPEFESGQMLIDKERCWQPLQLVHWYMQNSNNFYFNHVHGDKEIFHLAWRKLARDYAMVPHPICSLPGVMCQHDFAGHRVFQHRNGRKWKLAHNPATPGFDYEDQCFRFLDELRLVYCPLTDVISRLTPKDRHSMAEMQGKAFAYVRVGYDCRRIALEDGGQIGEGAAELETYWWRDGPRLILADSNASVTVACQPSRYEVWQGTWEKFERMPILLVPIS